MTEFKELRTEIEKLMRRLDVSDSERQQFQSSVTERLNRSSGGVTASRQYSDIVTILPSGDTIQLNSYKSTPICYA